jgi:hypothetical protein
MKKSGLGETTDNLTGNLNSVLRCYRIRLNQNVPATSGKPGTLDKTA